MFTLDTVLRTLAIIVGLLILSSYYFDFSYIISRLISKKTNVSIKVNDGNDQFLHIIDLWYKLRNECVNAKLDSAIKKLDEVFPLLNSKVEEKNV